MPISQFIPGFEYSFFGINNIIHRFEAKLSIVTALILIKTTYIILITQATWFLIIPHQCHLSSHSIHRQEFLSTSQTRSLANFTSTTQFNLSADSKGFLDVLLVWGFLSNLIAPETILVCKALLQPNNSCRSGAGRIHTSFLYDLKSLSLDLVFLYKIQFRLYKSVHKHHASDWT